MIKKLSKKWRNRHWKNIIQNSGLFDLKYYLFTYPDVRHSDIDPILHYIQYGVSEGRNPSNSFNTQFYLDQNIDVKEEGINPLVHYILHGKSEFRKTSKTATIPTSEIQKPEDMEFDEPSCFKNSKKRIKETLLSVICRTYNHEKHIKKALDGFVLQKTNFKFEVLIGDDLSSDNTPAIIEEYRSKYPDLFKVIPRTKNLGPVFNLVDLTQHVKSKYVAICEGDDYWIDPYKLYRQVKFLEENQDYTICFNKIIINYCDIDKQMVVAPEGINSTTSFHDLIHKNYIYMNSVVYRWIFKNGLHENNFNCKAMPADWQLHLHHANKGKIKLLKNIMGVYNKHSDGIWSSTENITLHHVKYGLKEIEFFKTFETFKHGKYKKNLIKKQLFIFKILANYYIDNDMYIELHNIILKEPKLYENIFADFGYNIKQLDISSVKDFKNSLKSQNSIYVVVTSFNHENYIRESLDSILRQSGCFTLKIIIGDDCSTDNTASIIKEYQLKEPGKISVLHRTKNLGMRANLKDCFNHCKGDYIAICEGDDYWSSDKKLHKQIVFMRNNQDCSMCFNWLNLYRQEKGIYEPHPQQQSLNTKKISFTELSKKPIIGNFSSCLYKTSSVKSIGDKYYNDPLGFDWLFNMYIATQGNVGFIKELLSVYRIHDNGQWSANSKTIMQEKIKKSQLNFNRHFSNLLQISREIN